MNRLIIVGAGPGDASYLTVQAVEALQSAVCIAAAKRHAPLAERYAPNAKLLPLEPLSVGVEHIAQALQDSDVVVLVSGDPTLFSLTRTLAKRIPDELAETVVLPGVGSMNTLLARLCESADGAKIISAHGRDLLPQSIAKTVMENKTTIIFADARQSPSWICETLTTYEMGDLDVAVGENLSYPDERIVLARAKELRGQSWGESCIMRIRNHRAAKRDVAPILPDAAFIRGVKQKDGKTSVVPMTKEEVRMLSVCKLRLTDDATVWDIGAGTGSVAVQCAKLICGMVYALERETDAFRLIAQNATAAKVPNVIPICGCAPEGLGEMPDPTHVFIGGSGGEISAILNHIKKRGSGIRVVLNAILPETAVDAVRLLQNGFGEVELLQVQISVGKPTPSGHLMSANNPVYILSAVTL